MKKLLHLKYVKVALIGLGIGGVILVAWHGTKVTSTSVGEDISGENEVADGQAGALQELDTLLNDSPLVATFQVNFHYQYDFVLTYDRWTHSLHCLCSLHNDLLSEKYYRVSPSDIHRVASKNGSLAMLD